MSRIRVSSNGLRRIVLLALFGAISYVLMLLVHFPISFLTLDVKDSVLILCGLYFGPGAAALLSVLVPVMELVTVSTTGLYGLGMNILGSLTLSVTVGLIYKYKKSFSGAVIGLLCGVVAMVAVMMGFNLLVTPYYVGMTVADVRAMIPTLLLPFNLVKGVLNAGLVLLVYKPLSAVMQHIGVLPPSAHPYWMSIRTVAVMLAALVLIGISLFFILIVLGGSFSFGT